MVERHIDTVTDTQKQSFFGCLLHHWPLLKLQNYEKWRLVNIKPMSCVFGLPFGVKGQRCFSSVSPKL